MAGQNTTILLPKEKQLGKKAIYDNPEKKYWLTKVVFCAGGKTDVTGQFFSRDENEAKATRKSLKEALEGEGKFDVFVDLDKIQKDPQGNEYYALNLPGQAKGGKPPQLPQYRGPLYTEAEYLKATDRLFSHFLKQVEKEIPDLTPDAKCDTVRSFVASALISWSFNIFLPEK